MLNTGNNQNKNLNPEGKSRELSPWLRRRLIQRMITPARPEGDLHRSAAPLPRNTRHTFGYSRLLTQLNSRPVLNVRDLRRHGIIGEFYLIEPEVRFWAVLLAEDRPSLFASDTETCSYRQLAGV
jgi:hypothetical protein